MDAPEESWKDEIREKLAEVFKDNVEDLVRVLFFLDEEDKAYKDNVARPYAPHWKSLKATLNMNKVFRQFSKRLADETRRAEKDQEFRKLMNIAYEEMMSHCDDTVGIEEYQKLDPNRLKNLGPTSTSALAGLARALDIIPNEMKVSIINLVRAVPSRFVVTAVDEVVSLANKMGGTVVMVGLAVVYLTYSAYVHIGRWWKGEITGKRCIKNLLDSMFTIGAGMAGGVAGAAIGSAVGPIGTAVGGMIGGWVSAAGMDYLSDWLTQKLFGLPKEESLENAYRYLGVEITASNAKVNTAFRKLCLKHHPDKGGNQQDFVILQCNMAIIKLARGEF